MCGISGVIAIKQREKISHLIQMSSNLSHRGPDDEGFYVIQNNDLEGIELVSNNSDKKIRNVKNIEDIKSEKFKYGFSHRRFSIIDTSINGHQPMLSNNKRIVLSFNGEIFNYKEIKTQLMTLGHAFISETDTEVVLKSYIEWGDDCFNRFNGFWAIAILDLDKNKVLLSRDRFGQKPLYYYTKNDNIYFSSEISSLRSVCPEINKLDMTSVYLYLYHDRKDSLTSSMYKDLQVIEPGSFSTIDLKNGKFKNQRYWIYPQVENNKKSARELAKELDGLLADAVKIRLRSDVPIAANLSGGLDSAAIVHYASEVLEKEKTKLTTHTFEYSEDKTLSEKDDAELIAEKCNTNHETLYFSSRDVWNDLRNLVLKIEEPVHSPSAYIQWIAWKKISKMGYKVIIHGASNDELMMGYSYYPSIIDKNKLRNFNLPLDMQGNSIFYYKNIGRLIKWLSKREIFFTKSVIKNYHPKNPVFNNEFLINNISNYNSIKTVLNTKDAESRRLADFKYLRIPFWNNFMDKSMMSIPIEVRFPFLDFNVVEFCFRNSNKLFYKRGWTKYLLRKVLSEKLPNRIVWNNRKKGFTSPTKDWLFDNKLENIDILKSNLKLSQFIDIVYIEKNYEKIDASLLWRIINFSIWVDVCDIEI